MMRMMTSGNAIGIEINDEIAGIEANADGQIPFRFNQGFGINSQSNNKALAWAFLKFLLSKEMQLSTNLFSQGFPLNNEARLEKVELLFTVPFASAGATPNDRLRQAIENYRIAMETLSDSINCYIIADTSLNDMIAQEVQYFFNGSRSAEEVARVLQNKADLYLSE
jgi:multiple sugar transport system substrate-binding protein